LEFDQVAFAHLLLQLNANQNLFDFQIIPSHISNTFPIPDRYKKNISQNILDFFIKIVYPNRRHQNSGQDILRWFIEGVDKFEQSENKKNYEIDYWISITSEKLTEKNLLFCQGKTPSSEKLVWVITSYDWEIENCPPSLFEYLVSLVIICALNTLSNDYGGKLHKHNVECMSGCIFEYTSDEKMKIYRRISVSNPLLCFACKRQLYDLDDTIKGKTGTEIPVYDEVIKMISKDWMGSPEERDTPLYNLNKNYGYNIDSHSGFYKKWPEIIRDSFKEKATEWIVGGIIGVIMLLLGNFFAGFLDLPG
jgi:hypothetical protein